jgi:signal transduction histidine kinase
MMPGRAGAGFGLTGRSRGVESAETLNRMLEQCPCFSGLTADELGELRRMAREGSYAAGQTIFKEGEPGDGVYVLQDGLVEISMLAGPNKQRVLSRLSAGALFGEIAVLDDQPRFATAAAVEPTAVLFFPRADFLGLVDRSRVLSRTLLRETSRRLLEFNRQHVRELLQAERLALIGWFARSIVHDLKNPVHIIGLAAEIACLPETSRNGRHRARNTIRQQIGAIKEMVGEILAFTQDSPENLLLTPLNYGALAHEILEEARRPAALKSVNLQLEGALPLVTLQISPQRVRRVFFNLIHNATAALPQGGTVFVRFQVKPTEVVTEVEDTGPGIPAEMLGHLFEAFATHRKEHGTGLGLFICKRIIEDHQGWISARNLPGRGAIFSFGLPLPKEAQAESVEPPAQGR